jgi:phenylpropionate dioxygenase-like ring-hydroxylating dioxygenase large terminal subunit
MISRVWPIDSRLRYWHPVARVSSVTTKPLAIQCCGVPITLFTNGRNTVVAMYDRCAHRRMPLSHGVVGPEGITCPYHGCRFAPDGTGFCPTTRSNRFRVPVFETKSLCGVVWLRSPDALDIEGQDAAAGTGLSNDLADDDHVFTCVIEKKISAPLQLVVDNMTELEHTGKVHRQLAFGISDFDTVDTHCEHDDQGVSIFYRGRQRPR